MDYFNLAPFTAEEQLEVTNRFENALNSFIDKLKPDSNIVALILAGSLAYDKVWQKSDMDTYLLINDIKIDTKSFCIDEDGILINVNIMKYFDFKRSMERAKGGDWLYSQFARAKVAYTKDESLILFLKQIQKMGEDDKKLSFLSHASDFIGSLEKIEKWLVVKNNLLYAQHYVLKAVDIFASMKLILTDEPLNRESVLRAMELYPDEIEPVYKKPMSGEMSRDEIINALNIYRNFLSANIEYLKEPVKNFMGDGGVKTITELSKHFWIHSHGIYHVFDFLAEHGIVEKVTQPARLTPKSKSSVEEIAYMYMG